MLRTSLRSVSGPSSRHVCLSCLARPGALGLRQFHRISALRIDIGETKPADLFDASIEPSAPLPPNSQIPETQDAASSESQKSPRRHIIPPRKLTAAVWDQMTNSQRTNYKRRHPELYQRFKDSITANGQTTLRKAVELAMGEAKLAEQEAAKPEAATSETTPSEAASEPTPSEPTPSEAARVEAEKVKALHQRMATEEARRERKSKSKEEKRLANAKLEPKMLKGKEGLAATPAVSELEKTRNSESTSNTVAQILETSSKNGVESPNKPSLKVEMEEKADLEEGMEEKKEVDEPLSFLKLNFLSKDRGALQSKDPELRMKEVRVPMAPVPRVAFGLDRVLFNPGVYQLRDHRTRVYNFDPYLDQIMPVSEFDFGTLKPYITSSKDVTACEITKKNKKKYYGSSSSMTSVLSHFHFLLSAWRPVDISKLTQGFGETPRNFTRLLRAPTAMFLRYNEADDIYAIDADKEYDSANILMHLGKSMEKQLTLPKEKFERYRRSDANKITAEEEASVPESYHYSTMGNFLLRGQLDAYDPRLPGTGMFDLKTRAVVSIRMEPTSHERGMGYEIRRRFGKWESYEREYFDMIRAAFLKYSLQVRVGRMDGIFVAYHNVERIFGFQYITLGEMDQALHGQDNVELGNAEFELSIGLWEKILDKATQRFPKQSLRFHFETRDGPTPFMYIVAQPVTNEEIDAIQSKNQAQIDDFTDRLFNPDKYQPEESESVESAESKPEGESLRTDEKPKTKSLADSLADALYPVDPADGLVEAGEEGEEGEFETPESTILSDASVSEPEAPKPEVKAEAEPKTKDAENKPEPAKWDGYDENLLAMTLMVNSKVNGVPVQRPSYFTPSDRWSINYELNELDVEEGNTILRLLKNRRNQALRKNVQDHSNVFFTNLQKVTNRGRAWRKRLDKQDRDRGILVYKDSSEMEV